MAFQGSLREFSASDILQLLGTQKKNGSLLLEHGEQRLKVYVKDGRIVSTRGGGPLADDALMRFIRRIRRLSEEQQRGIASLHQESGRDLEDLLANGRYLDAEELAAILERQILEDLIELVEWQDGTYRFDPTHCWGQAALARLNMEAALIEAARRADERKRFRETLPDPQQLVSVCGLPAPDDELTAEESELFAIIDGQHTIAEVVAAAPLSDYEAYEALQRMLESAWIELLGHRPSAGGDAPASPPRPTVPVDSKSRPQVRVSLLRELAVAAAVIVGVLGVWLGAQALRAPASARPQDTVFAAVQVRDVRYALELYRREHGSYPDRLEDLVAGQWLEARQLVVNGERLRYRLNPARGDYDLILTGRH